MLQQGGKDGLRNVDIGFGLGVYRGYSGSSGKEVQQGHLTRIIPERLKVDGLVEQDAEDKRWMLRSEPLVRPGTEIGD